MRTFQGGKLQTDQTLRHFVLTSLSFVASSKDEQTRAHIHKDLASRSRSHILPNTLSILLQSSTLKAPNKPSLFYTETNLTMDTIK